MDKGQEQVKKPFCARCFLPVDSEDTIEIAGQSFHRICCTCCVCRTIPSAVKMFYGHVFCNGCFKQHVLDRFRGECPSVHTNWAQWTCGKFGNGQEGDNPGASSKSEASEGNTKRSVCSRCLQMINENNKIEIDKQAFHSHCAKCYFCHTVPSSNIHICYGQVFCEPCFQHHVLHRHKDNPNEFFKQCFEQFADPRFAENMKQFMAGKDGAPFVFMQGQQPPFCRCGTGPQEWFGNSEPKKSTTTIDCRTDDSTLELSFENRTDTSDVQESSNVEIETCGVEKIEKLTKYLQATGAGEREWKNFDGNVISESLNGWIDLQKGKTSDCLSCLWQTGCVFYN
ncbi:uncharacterized protein LOC101743651 isoform X1 [Bombyx mori]|uniref:LIM zinc-binding domain-containing protein n=1 Tax=Bombyx mori TaxID=7091 RepID=A0A8R1WMX9_BOMMO|nr:uncharacterized protein LOC101743651 isoform X1 [Bombyx mori]